MRFLIRIFNDAFLLLSAFLCFENGANASYTLAEEEKGKVVMRKKNVRVCVTKEETTFKISGELAERRSRFRDGKLC